MKMILLGAAALAAVPAMAQMQHATPAPRAMPPMGPMAEQAQTRDQVVAKVRDHFAKMDTNRDGFVAGDEMQAMRGHHQRADGKQTERDARKERRQQAAFEWLDRNRDNMISRSEYSSFRAVRGQSAGARGTAPMVMPGDRPGMRMNRMGGGHGMGGGGGMLRMADLDRDGRVSLQEATAKALEHFDRVDTNRDGRITPDERRSNRDQRKQMRAPKAG